MSYFITEDSTSNLDTLQKILNSKKIRYEVLDDFFKLRLARQQGKTVNIFVDHQSVIKQLYTPELLPLFNSINARDRIVIASELVNIIGHYRHYFASRLKMYTNVYYIYSFDEATYQKSIYPDYKSDYYFKRLAKPGSTIIYGSAYRILRSNLNIAQSVSNYIPHAYFIDSKDIEPALIPNYIINNLASDNDFNLILTNDESYFQDLNLNNTMIMEMRGSEKSELIDILNVVDVSLRSTKKTSADFPLVDHTLMETVGSMINNKTYSMPAIGRRGYSSSYSLMQKLLDKGQIEAFKLPDPEYSKELAPLFFKKPEQVEEYKRNIDVMSHKLGVEHNAHLIKPLVESQLIDFYNPQELRKASDGAFNKFPILFDYAYEGELLRHQKEEANKVN